MRSTSFDERPEIGPPLWSIGLIVAVMLIVPMVLFLVAPAGPIREGDSIFSNAQHKVALANPRLDDHTKYEGTCLLDPHNPLIVLQRPSDRADDSILAQVQGKSTMEWPFCPPHADVIVARHQVMQDPLALIDVKTSLRDLSSR